MLAAAATPTSTLDRRWLLRMSAHPRNARTLRAAAETFATDCGLDVRDVESVKFAVGEAVTNAIVHAYVGATPGAVTLSMLATEDRLLIEVADEGRGLQPRVDSPGMGLGLPLMSRLADDVRFTSLLPHGTSVTMSFLR